MSKKQEKQEKIEQIRSETAQHGNTKERVAGILTDLNNDKLETDLSNLPEESKAKLQELLGATESVATASGSAFERE